MKFSQLARPWQRNAEYHRYLMEQAAKTDRFRGLTHVRVIEMIGLLRNVTEQGSIAKAALSVGCRNIYEPKLLELAGFDPVVGIDLLSSDPIIVPMDMHKMAFPDQHFDVVFSCHSLEHAYDVDVALKEWNRVTKPGGVWAIEVPVNFPTTLVDRHDFHSLAELKTVCSLYASIVLYEHEIPTEPGRARLIVRTIGKES